MALQYVAPGVTVQEITSPVVSGFLATGTQLCLVGMSAGSVPGKNTVVLNGTAAVAIPGVAQNATMTSGSLASVVDATSLVTYTTSTDYTFTVNNSVGSTNLSADLSATETNTISVASTTNFPSAGVLLIDNEQVQYTAKTSTTFTTLTRGAGGTVTSAHSSGATVVQPKYTIARVGGGSIVDGSSVILSFTYTPADYFTAQVFDSLGAVQDRYGQAQDANGNVISDVSFGAQLAFENGAPVVTIQPLFYNSSNVRTQPIAGSTSSTTGSWAALGTWNDTTAALRDLDDVNLVVPVIGQNRQNVDNAAMVTNVFAAIQSHLAFMQTQQQYLFAVLGEDSTPGGSNADRDTLRSHAATCQSRTGGTTSQQIALVSPGRYIRQTSTSGQNVYRGGQYVAASIGGMLAARRVSSPLTRQTVAGYIGVGDVRTKAEKNGDAQAGLLVVEQKGQSVQVRHGITLDGNNTAVRQISVVRAKFNMVESVRQTIENQVLGKVVADGSAPSTVSSVVTSVLEQLKKVGDIVGYQGVQSRTLQLDPTTVEVRFSYKPAFPLDYVNIVFSIDLTNGTVA